MFIIINALPNTMIFGMVTNVQNIRNTKHETVYLYLLQIVPALYNCVQMCACNIE